MTTSSSPLPEPELDQGAITRKHPDRLAAIASGFVAALALAVSTYNVYLQRQQIRAQVWPRLEWTYSNLDGFAFELQNSGVGPAEVKSVRVAVDGKEVADWSEAVRLLLGKEPDDLITSTMHGRVLGPGVQIKPIDFRGRTEASTKFEQNRRRIHVDICFCSTLGECWLLRNGKQIETAGKCPSYARPFEQ